MLLAVDATILRGLVLLLVGASKLFVELVIYKGYIWMKVQAIIFGDVA